MIDTVVRQTCDVCGKHECVANSENVPSWTIPSEVGDLCPSCARAWEEHKADFLIRMRKENGKDLV
ncbi:hypothetical protein [Butyrivibrio sp. INlla21]|uniref:hypothetical protein n=1 Tax=Butyrivibrio sp. INlla21 TaxID=1520811 RepID=UPI0008F2F0D1|nr:hypothetical protein [Butyrivibrio sp. INlla21]SFU32932.1 hypothetical protein SAMN02910342_00099 [Butyrivibrio sp. INlla21]